MRFFIKTVKLIYQKLARRLGESPTFCFLGYLKKTNFFWSTFFAEKWNYSGTHSFYRCKRVWAQIWPRRKIIKNAQKRLRVDPWQPKACRTPPGDPKWSQNGPKMDQTWSLNGPKIKKNIPVCSYILTFYRLFVLLCYLVIRHGGGVRR